MHAIKCGWVGQTFAMAKNNESGGRKARIRRSKEERKDMVESFIKTYQKLNRGNFPSLNLTHKEVGGSFYIVREIVREIIQENRVLGPAKLDPDEQQYPFVSISIEPQFSSSMPSTGTHLGFDHRVLGQEILLNSVGQYTVSGVPETEKSQVLGGNLIFNGHRLDEKNKGSGKLQETESLETDQVDEEPGATDVTEILGTDGGYFCRSLCLRLSISLAMHAIKCGWVGQTFAMAKNNESGGRKARIRRSKEERKDMVESFIKTYQKLNRGNFPSLNLTHKEVGGSFYIVREIVREIIQENRVLGPAKLDPDEQQYPFVSISIEPQFSSSMPSTGTHLGFDHRVLGQEILLNSVGQYTVSGVPETEKSQVLGGNLIFNGHRLDEKNKGSGKLQETESLETDQVDEEPGATDVTEILGTDVDVEEPEEEQIEPSNMSETLEADENAIEKPKETWIEARDKPQMLEILDDIVEEPEASTALVSQITANITVETFPMEPSSVLNKELGGKPMEKKLIQTAEDSKAENTGLHASKHASILPRGLLEKTSSVVDEELGANHEDNLLKTDSLDSGEAVLLNFENKPVKNSHEDVEQNVKDGGHMEVSTLILTATAFEQDQKLASNKPMVTLNGVDVNGTTTTDLGDLNLQQEIVENETDVQSEGSLQSKPTLDRININSWDKASKRRADPETNHLLALFKAFITAFMKFWSD